jgi:hypothetical protein
VVCLFQNGIPWLIQECDTGAPQHEYLVTWTQNNPCILPATELTGGELADISKARQHLATREKTNQENEAKLKQWLVDRHRKGETQKRNQRFTDGAADRRAAASDRIGAHNAQKSAVMESNWRSALDRSGF